MTARNATGLVVDVTSHPDLPALPAAVEVAAYRIVLEAVTNVVHHAGARRCTVTIAAADALSVQVVDDGLGLPEQGGRAGAGIELMRARAAELGGVLDVETRAGGGTVLTARLPLLVPA